MTRAIRKYPRTRHLETSRLQPGDEDLAAVPFGVLLGENVVVEEKIDGANAAISFDAGQLLLQSRGHYLTGGPRERHFGLLKTWAACHRSALRRLLGDRYVLYGEWVYAKHTVFYDALPHYLLEFDVLDLERDCFLSTARRRELLAGSPVVSVPVLYEGSVDSLEQLWAMVGPSLYKSPDWRRRLETDVVAQGLDVQRCWSQTDRSEQSEGLYLKVEQGGVVTERYKLVRPGFLQAVMEGDGHWLDRPIVPNRLADGVDLYGASP